MSDLIDAHPGQSAYVAATITERDGSQSRLNCIEMMREEYDWDRVDSIWRCSSVPLPEPGLAGLIAGLVLLAWLKRR